MSRFRMVDEPTYEVRADELGRFDQRNTAFGRRRGEGQTHYNPPRVDKAHQDPASALHTATAAGSRTVDQYLRPRFLGIAAGAEAEVAPDRIAGDADENTKLIKQTACTFGASLVGICRVNPLWVYSRNGGGDAIELPESITWAIVMAVAMDPSGIRQSPGAAAASATHVGYMQMSVLVAGLSETIRALGFAAVACGNDTALSIPLAIDAGLGEMGRHGLLITPAYGPCVRLCKVFTDMPLQADHPIDMGVSQICRVCNRCTNACPIAAIDEGEEPTFDGAGPCTNPGVRRWPVDSVQCLSFWSINGCNCSNCIAACPFTPQAPAGE